MQTPNVRRRITMGEGREGEGRNRPQKKRKRKKEKKREGKYNNLRHENKNK